MNRKFHLSRTGTDLRCILAGLTLMLLALLMRLAALTPAGAALAALQPPQLRALAVQALTAPSVSAATASTEVSRPERPPKQTEPEPEAQTEPEPEAQTEPEPKTQDETILPESLAFTAAEADAIPIRGTCTYEVDKASLLQADPVHLGQTEPQVLIVHSHTTEAYTPEPGAAYIEASGEYRTLDPQHNMLRIGAKVAEVLQSCGIGAVHDTAVNDDPSYEDAYDRSAQRIEAQLAAHPSIQIVLDLHRDAAEDAQGQAVALSSRVDGSDAAQLMLVVGTDEGGLPHPDWQRNLSFALQLQAWIGRSHPDLCRGLSLRQARYNQHYTPASILVEVGSTGNTMTEALRSAELLGRELAAYLHSAAGTTNG